MNQKKSSKVKKNKFHRFSNSILIRGFSHWKSIKCHRNQRQVWKSAKSWISNFTYFIWVSSHRKNALGVIRGTIFEAWVLFRVCVGRGGGLGLTFSHLQGENTRWVDILWWVWLKWYNALFKNYLGYSVIPLIV